RPLDRERPHVELVDDEFVEAQTETAGRRELDDSRRPVYARRLEARAGIGQPARPVEDVHVVLPRGDAEPGDEQLAVALELVRLAAEADGDGPGGRRPDRERGRPVSVGDCPEPAV